MYSKPDTIYSFHFIPLHSPSYWCLHNWQPHSTPPHPYLRICFFGLFPIYFEFKTSFSTQSLMSVFPSIFIFQINTSIVDLLFSILSRPKWYFWSFYLFHFSNLIQVYSYISNHLFLFSNLIKVYSYIYKHLFLFSNLIKVYSYISNHLFLFSNLIKIYSYISNNLFLFSNLKKVNSNMPNHLFLFSNHLKVYSYISNHLFLISNLIKVFLYF